MTGGGEAKSSRRDWEDFYGLFQTAVCHVCINLFITQRYKGSLKFCRYCAVTFNSLLLRIFLLLN